MFAYGLPLQVTDPKTRFSTFADLVVDPDEDRKFKKHWLRVHIDLGLLIAGFALQLVGTPLPALLPLLAKLTLPPVLVWVWL